MFKANSVRKSEHVNMKSNWIIHRDLVEALSGSDNRTTHYVGAVSGVNKDLVVGVGLSLHLLGAVRSWRLTFAAATTGKTRVTFNAAAGVCLVRPAAGDQSRTCQTWEG